MQELVRRGHDVTVVVRDASRAPAGAARVVIGDAAQGTVLADAVTGADAVVSVLGPTAKDPDLHRRTVAALVPAMRAAGVARFVGISGAGVDAPGDRKRRRDRVISRLMKTFGGALVADKAGELAAWQSSGLEWTLVRPPRLADGPASGSVEHDAHVSTSSTRMTRGDLAAFLVDVLEDGLYMGQAPFAATR